MVGSYPEYLEALERMRQLTPLGPAQPQDQQDSRPATALEAERRSSRTADSAAISLLHQPLQRQMKVRKRSLNDSPTSQTSGGTVVSQASVLYSLDRAGRIWRPPASDDCKPIQYTQGYLRSSTDYMYIDLCFGLKLIGIDPVTRTRKYDDTKEWPKVSRYKAAVQAFSLGGSNCPTSGVNVSSNVSSWAEHIHTDPAHGSREPTSYIGSPLWSTILDSAERRRVQNRIAQRNYRKKLKKRLEDLEHRASMSAIEDESDLVTDTAKSFDPQVMVYQRPTDFVTIKCVCGNTNDHRFIIPCIACGKWQHITCYYDLAQDIVESHECSNCSNREPAHRRKDALKRNRPEDLELTANTSAKRSQKRPKTAGGASSFNLRTYATSQSSHIDDNTWSSYSVLEFPQALVPSEPDNSALDTSLVVNPTQVVNTKGRSSSGPIEQDPVALAVEAEDEPITPRNAASNEVTVLEGVAEHAEGTKVGEENTEDFREVNILTHATELLQTDWTQVQDLLPESWKWDTEYQNRCWTCTPCDAHTPASYPLNIAGSPVVLPVEFRWPPVGGMNPPPDPRPSAPIDYRAALQMDVVRDVFLTFEGSVGFYLLISGLLQLVVPEEFDMTWAASHLPHKYGGLKVCYIAQSLEPTMLPLSTTETSHSEPGLVSTKSGLSSIFKQSRSSSGSLGLPLKLNDFIEARPKSIHRKEKYAGRIGLKVAKAGEPYLIMSTHVITEAILAKSHRTALFPRTRGCFGKLEEDWNNHVEIWAHNERFGTIQKSFDEEAEIYPDGFRHDVTLIKPSTPASIKNMASPMPGIGWLNQDAWRSLRQRISAVKVLGPTEAHRSSKSIKCSRPSEILVVGEGIFLNQTAAAGNSKSLKDHDISTWKSLVSRALLYRVYPDFDPPNGYSGVALYADGTRQDGTIGPGIVGFQSFVQRSGHVQNFNMEGPALEKRLQLGRVAFYGAFEVPEELKRDYTIV